MCDGGFLLLFGNVSTEGQEVKKKNNCCGNSQPLLEI